MQRGNESWSSSSRRRSNSPDRRRDRDWEQRRERDYQPSAPTISRDPRSRPGWGAAAAPASPASSNTSETAPPKILKRKSPPPSTLSKMSSSGPAASSPGVSAHHVRFIESLCHLLSLKNDVAAQSKKTQQLRDFVAKNPARASDYQPRIAEAEQAESKAKEQYAAAEQSFAEQHRAMLSSSFKVEIGPTEESIKNMNHTLVTTRYQSETSVKRLGDMDKEQRSLSKTIERVERAILEVSEKKGDNDARISALGDRLRRLEDDFDRSRRTSGPPAGLDAKSQRLVQAHDGEIKALKQEIEKLRNRPAEKSTQGGSAPANGPAAPTVQTTSSGTRNDAAGTTKTSGGDDRSPAAANLPRPASIREVEALKNTIAELNRRLVAQGTDLRFDMEEALDHRMALEKQESETYVKQLVDEHIKGMVREHRERRKGQASSTPATATVAPQQVGSEVTTAQPVPQAKSVSPPSTSAHPVIGLSEGELVKMVQQAIAFQLKADSDKRNNEEKDRLKALLRDPELAALRGAESTPSARSLEALQQQMLDVQAGYEEFKKQTEANRERHRAELAQAVAQREAERADRMALQHKVTEMEEALRSIKAQDAEQKKYRAGQEKVAAVHGSLIHALADVLGSQQVRGPQQDTHGRPATSAGVVQQSQLQAPNRQPQTASITRSPQMVQSQSFPSPVQNANVLSSSPSGSRSPNVSLNQNGHTHDPRIMNAFPHQNPNSIGNPSPHLANR